MIEYAILNSDWSIIEIVEGLEEAKKRGNANKYAAYIRPIDEKATANNQYSEVCIEGGNCNAYIVEGGGIVVGDTWVTC